MPPKIKPRPRNSVRKNLHTSRELELEEAMSAPSHKEALTNDDNEMQNTSDSADRTELLEIQPESSTSQDKSTSTPIVAAGAPSPRRSVQRLRSALPRNAPNPASNLNTSIQSDSRPTSLKFKPKSFIRRSKEEREAEEKAEAERRAARQAEEGTSSTNDRGGFHVRGRGRGQRGGFGDMNRWKTERFNLSHEASGHLGGSTIQDGAMSRKKRGGGFRSGYSGSLESASANGTSRVKKEPNVKPEKDKDGDVVMDSKTSKPKRTKVKKEEQGPTYISSEGELDSDEGERVNIEDISTVNLISSEDEDEDGEPVQRSRISKGKRREATPQVPSSNLMPVRIQRQEHVERTVGVNTDASSLTSAELRRRAKNRAEAEGSLFLPDYDESDRLSKPKIRRKPKDVEFVRDERKWKGVYQDDEDKDVMVKIKTEPKDDREVVIDDNPMDEEEVEPIALEDIEFANTTTQRTVRQGNHTLRSRASFDELVEATEEGTPQPGERLPKIKGYHGLRPVSFSEEEEEDDILVDIAEIVLLKDNISAKTSKSELASSTNAPHEDSDVDMDREETYFQQGGREEVYLFQLPPIVPSLRDVSKTVAKSEDKKNKAAPAELSRTSASSDQFAAQVKEEPIMRADPDELLHEASVPHAYTSDSFLSIGGRGGVLSIHAKGSMFATWGGMSFEIIKEGTGAKLAQELVMTEYESAVTKVEDESRWEEKVSVGQRGWAMGQMQPGHVCVPELLS